MHVRSAQSFRDRTQEFQSIADQLKKSFSSGSVPNGPSSSSKSEEQRSAVAIQSEFNKRASKIGYGIHQTSQKLAKLAKLAKRTSVFDDPTKEIQELTALIKQDITALNSAVVDLQLHCNSRNESGNVSSDTNSHSTAVVDDLKNQLMSTTKEFKEVLTMRTEVWTVLLGILASSSMLLISLGFWVEKRIGSLFRNFLCGSIGEEKKFHLVSWKKVCQPLDGGGLGIKDLKVFNRALLGKWLWRYHLESEALWKNVIDVEYGSLWGGWCSKASSGAYGVSLWKFIRKGWDFFSNNFRLKVGDGKRILFWHDLWCGDTAL
ncbi:syntaxin-32-like isoform X2 [Carya illinoinensis]|uniref:syntaxin-32-like isoform X2 n=1 Tax=Carya illinoinensis TaxID=32201 RepID=UPI001C71E394|nr:syntaxin-32-like isoform X2 [Carya illinoinensis]